MRRRVLIVVLLLLAASVCLYLSVWPITSSDELVWRAKQETVLSIVQSDPAGLKTDTLVRVLGEPDFVGTPEELYGLFARAWGDKGADYVVGSLYPRLYDFATERGKSFSEYPSTWRSSDFRKMKLYVYDEARRWPVRRTLVMRFVGCEVVKSTFYYSVGSDDDQVVRACDFPGAFLPLPDAGKRGR
jgi:hypothetical protein